MKNILYFLFFSFLIISCCDDLVETDELIGDWEFEREVTPESSLDTFEINDKSGVFTFSTNGFGRRESVINIFDFELEWSINDCGKQISIRKTGFTAIDTRTYDIERIDDDNIIFEGIIRREVTPDSTIETIERFELTRI
ncbi:MAG: hypothetical protein AAGA77_03310 [Bacteroidota bacterium]